MNIGIFGAGFVGTTTGLVLCEFGHRVTIVDNDSEKIKIFLQGILPFYEPGIEDLLRKHLKTGAIAFSTDGRQTIEDNYMLFICVGTPANFDGSSNLEYVKEVAESIGRHMNSYKVVVNKSTAPVGTSDRIRQWIVTSQENVNAFDVVVNPEFLREGNALADALHPERIIIGSDIVTALTAVKQLYEGMNCPIITTSARAAELIKYASNAFLATKISFVNELARLCDEFSINIQDVTAGMGLDLRIGSQFLNAGIGYGGSCFPKDTRSLLYYAAEVGVRLGIINETIRINETQHLYILQRLKKHLRTFQAKKIAVFGFSFKPFTSDTRESRALSIIEELLRQDAIVSAHDPVAKIPPEFASSVEVCTTPEEAASAAEAIVICTEWPLYRDVDWKQIAKIMKSPCVFDGVNMLDVIEMDTLGFDYFGIGRSVADSIAR